MGRTWIDNKVLDAGLTAQQLAVYIQIKRRMCGITDEDRNKYLVERDGVMYFSLKGINVREIAKAARVDKSNVSKFIAEMAEMNIGITYDKGGMNGAKKSTNVYYIAVSEEEFRGQQMEDETVRAYTGGVRREDPDRQEEPKRPGHVPTRKSREEAMAELEKADTFGSSKRRREKFKEDFAHREGYMSHEEMVKAKEEERRERERKEDEVRAEREHRKSVSKRQASQHEWSKQTDTEDKWWEQFPVIGGKL